MTKKFLNQPLHIKLILPVVITMACSLLINLFLFGKIDSTVGRMEQVYATNIRLSELEDLLTEMEDDIYQYLNVQNQDSLDVFLQNREQFEAMVSEIDDRITDHPIRSMELNIRKLAFSYLQQADHAIAAKQDHQVSEYRETYGELQKIYSYLLSYIRGLDNLRFKSNSENYDVLYQSLRYVEIFIISILIGATCCLILLFHIFTGNITRPLEQLAEKAKEVGAGNFNISMDEPESEDEVGMVTRTFQQMVCSIQEYIKKTKETMEMENLLKDAQLKYYQAQIDPHFLFNTLNAGQQLAMMEDAERTYEFMENTAAFFRYRLNKNGKSSTLREELELIDNYMYIMNVRYSNEIHIEKEIDERLLGISFPGMVLQPIVENALRHGLGDIEWEKKIWFTVKRVDSDVQICIRDNGNGMSSETLQMLNGEDYVPTQQGTDSGNGVGLLNVRERLRLYFNRKDVMCFESGGTGMGTRVLIRIPAI